VEEIFISGGLYQRLRNRDMDLAGEMLYGKTSGCTSFEFNSKLLELELF